MRRLSERVRRRTHLTNILSSPFTFLATSRDVSLPYTDFRAWG